MSKSSMSIKSSTVAVTLGAVLVTSAAALGVLWAIQRRQQNLKSQRLAQQHSTDSSSSGSSHGNRNSIGYGDAAGMNSGGTASPSDPGAGTSGSGCSIQGSTMPGSQKSCSHEGCLTAVHRAVRVPISKDIREPTSFANFDSCAVTHMSLDLDVDFQRRVLQGTVVVHAAIRRDGTSELVLDTSSLTVTGVRVLNSARSFQNAEYSFGDKHKAFGTALRINLPGSPRKAGTDVQVEILYETAPGEACSAVQWLPPEQTAGRVHPYLFTQNQPIHCRSMIPCQDAPAVKCTYDARITVPDPLVALMGAIATSDGSSNGAPTSSSGDRKSYTFKQEVPVPAYLVALAVGDLESRDIGPRTRVWAEPSVVDLGAYEFAETEKFLKTAESICGPYVWGRYDLLMLPPSFPYGGMENPTLTFVTPTLLAGDRSLGNIIAHEIAHSWSGNLVTNATWQDFWLNEGFTVFIERRIIQRIYGSGIASLKQQAGWHRLKDSVELFGKDHDFTRLHVPLEDEDPDNAFSMVPYEKGATFLLYLEDLVGGPELFEAFLKAYILRFQYGTVSWTDFKTFFLEYFGKYKKLPEATLNTIDWDKWVHAPGMPDWEPPLDTSLIDAVSQAAAHWLDKRSPPSWSSKHLTSWSADQLIAFVQLLLDADDELITTELIDAVDKWYNFSSTRNSEVLFRWCLLCLKTRDERRFGMVVRFLLEQGRMKFVRPLYRALFQAGPKGKATALDTFKENRSRYHAIAQKMIARDFGLEE